MKEITLKLYNTICQEILDKEMNRFESRNKLAEILTNFDVLEVYNDPEKCDLKSNIDRFLKERKKKGVGNSTLRGYKLQLDLFSNYFDKRVQDITSEDIDNFLIYRQENSRITSKSSLDTIRRIVKIFFDWLRDEGTIIVNPMAKIVPYELPEPKIEPLEIEELELLREACITERERAIIEVFYATGCTVKEISCMTLDDIDWHTKKIRIRGKGKKDRFVFISPRAIIYYKKYLATREDDCAALFVTERKPFRFMGIRAIQREIGNIADRTTIKKKITPQTFRQTFATLLLNNGCPMYMVQRLLGHEMYSNTSKTYAKVKTRDVQQAYEKFLY